MIVDILEHHKANGAVGRGDQQAGVHKRHVIADKERAAAFGDVIASLDLDAVKRMRQEPKQETQQRIGQQVENVEGRNKRQSRGNQEDLLRVGMAQPDHGVLRYRLQSDADERKKVCGRDDAALAVRSRTVLDQGVRGDRKEAGEETQDGEIHGDCHISEVGTREQSRRRP